MAMPARARSAKPKTPVRLGMEPRPRCTLCGYLFDLTPLEGDVLEFHTSRDGEKYAGKILVVHQACIDG